MFSCSFISATTGTSSKTGMPWYKLDLIGHTPDGQARILSEFCSKRAFDSAQGLKPMQPCTAFCNITERGKISIDALKIDNKKEV